MNRTRAIPVILALGIGLTAIGLSTPGRAAQDGGTLVDAVTQATEPFQDVAAAEEAGYAPMFGCVSGPQDGAMGVHYIKGELVGDGQLVADQPEALIYELRDGEWRFLGVEYLVLAEAWDAEHDGPPALMGQHVGELGVLCRPRVGGGCVQVGEVRRVDMLTELRGVHGRRVSAAERTRFMPAPPCVRRRI
jgi:hypothetical protein